MIYVTLGTQACDFSRCLRMIEELVNTCNITERIIAQTGYTKYTSKYMECFDFVPEDKYQEYIESADVVISHAGTGALFSTIKKGKKVIAVARLSSYGEMINDHQTEIVRKLSEEGYILDGTYSLVDAWEQLPSFNPRPDDFTCELPNKIVNLLTKWGITEK